MTGIMTATTAALITALALTATSAVAGTARSPTKTTHAAKASVQTPAHRPASAFEAARGVSSRASIDPRPDVPGYPPAQAAQ
jgi:hypothetical protein